MCLEKAEKAGMVFWRHCLNPSEKLMYLVINAQKIAYHKRTFDTAEVESTLRCRGKLAIMLGQFFLVNAQDCGE